MTEKTTEDKEEEGSGSLMWLGIGAGIIVGGILIALFLRSRSTTPAPAAYIQAQEFPNTPPIIIYPTFNLQIPIPGTQPANVMDMSQPVDASGQNIMQSGFGVSAYQNKESWEIERGEDGLIKNISVFRDVKLDANPEE